MNASFDPSVSTIADLQSVYTEISANEQAVVAEVLNLDTLSSAQNSPPTFASVNPPSGSNPAVQSELTLVEACLYTNSMVNILG